MPDRALASTVAEALETLDSALKTYGPVQRLDPRELASRYRQRDLVGGWRLEIGFSDAPRSLDILAPKGFPWLPVRAALTKAPPLLRWPHVEADGVLCLPQQLSMETGDQLHAVLANVLGRAHRLIESFVSGDHLAEFRAEFNTYWTYKISEDRRNVVSLCAPDAKSTIAFAWSGKNLVVIADTRAELAEWVSNFSEPLKPNSKKILETALLRSPRVPIPRQFPSDGATFNALVRSCGPEAVAAAEKVLLARQATSLFLLNTHTVNGPTFAGFALESRPLGRYRALNGVEAILDAGFRSTPSSVLMPRIVGNSRIKRLGTSRADPAWIHGRDADPDFPRLRGATIVIVGCGSLGGDAAVLLAKAGVGSFILIDFDRLRSQNTSRHVLGAQYVGWRKAKALAEKLRKDFPHLKSVQVRTGRIESLLLEEPELLADADLVVAATGEYSADSMISNWQAGSPNRPAVLYAWTEEHACAGHALLIRAGQGCFKCGFDERESPVFRVTRWPSDQLIHEPGCGAVFQPYGAVELSNTSTLVAGVALDAILGRGEANDHEIWAAPLPFLKRAGGGWSQDWLREFPDAAEGGVRKSREWLNGRACACDRKVAAE